MFDVWCWIVWLFSCPLGHAILVFVGVPFVLDFMGRGGTDFSKEVVGVTTVLFMGGSVLFLGFLTGW